MNKKFKKNLTVSTATAMSMSIVLPSVSVIASPAVTNGWVKDNGTWYYYNSGTIVKNGWAKDSKGWCYLNAIDGSWVQEGWAKDSKGWCYLREGYWVAHATWAKDSQGWQFIGSNGYWDSSVAVKAINPIAAAATAVAKAEESKLMVDIDAAKALVNALDSAIPEKTDLTNKVTAVVPQISTDDDTTAANEVDTLIAALPAAGTVTLEDQAEIEAARTAYDGLTDTQKGLVTNLTALEAAEAELSALADTTAADEVDTLIAALPASGTVTLEDQAEIEAARTAYDALTDTQKGLVTNLTALEAAEAELSALADTTAADEVDTLIAALPAAGTVTLEDQAEIEAARTAYDALTDTQKGLVTNLTALEAAEAELAAL